MARNDGKTYGRVVLDSGWLVILSKLKSLRVAARSNIAASSKYVLSTVIYRVATLKRKSMIYRTLLLFLALYGGCGTIGCGFTLHSSTGVQDCPYTSYVGYFFDRT